MTQPKTTRIPTPLYAAVGAGDLAYRKLRRLPTVITDLTGKAASGTAELREKATAGLRTGNLTTDELRGRAVTATAELREKTAATLRTANATAVRLRARAVHLDRARVRGLALRNVALVVAGAQAAQERTVAVYDALVSRGERAVGSGVVQAADVVNADIEATTTPTETAVTPATPGEAVAAEPAPKAAKATKAAKRTTGTTRGTTAKTVTKATKTVTKATKSATTAVKRTHPTAK